MWVAWGQGVVVGTAAGGRGRAASAQGMCQKGRLPCLLVQVQSRDSQGLRKGRWFAAAVAAAAAAAAATAAASAAVAVVGCGRALPGLVWVASSQNPACLVAGQTCQDWDGLPSHSPTPRRGRGQPRAQESGLGGWAAWETSRRHR